ncbi:hypothetical protein B0O99DRAFT_594264 [Bisporella sp. PMI_857]|nr:hypothetical protein B0O99DRAFT_594264 [Bisporella sp. PMI_857]
METRNLISLFANLRDIHPLNNYLAFCELGIRFAGSQLRHEADHPIKGKPNHCIRMHSTDPECKAIRDYVQNMSEFDANAWFCSEAKGGLMQWVFDGESDKVNIDGVGRSIHKVRAQKQRCRDWGAQNRLRLGVWAVKSTIADVVAFF